MYSFKKLLHIRQFYLFFFGNNETLIINVLISLLFVNVFLLVNFHCVLNIYFGRISITKVHFGFIIPNDSQ